MKFRIAVCTAIVFLIAFAVPALAADPLIAKIQSRYDALKSMRAEFSQTLLHKESGGKEERKGVLLFKKPLLVRWETTSPVPELLIVTPSVIWNAFPDEELAYKYPPGMADDSRSLVRVVTGQARLDQDFTIEKDPDEKGLAVIRLYPKEPTQSLTEAVLWVDPASGLIKRVRVYDFYNNENEIVFTTQDVGAAAPDSSFSYAPPKGFKVEDRTQEGAVKKDLLR